MFAISPNQIDYLQDLATFGAGYHTHLDQLDVVLPGNVAARENQFICDWSPCMSLELLWAFDQESLVGLRFSGIASLLAHYGKHPREFTVKELLEACDQWLLEWETEQLRKNANEHTKELIQSAKTKHALANDFGESARDFLIVPNEVMSKLLAALARKKIQTKH